MVERRVGEVGSRRAGEGSHGQTTTGRLALTQIELSRERPRQPTILLLQPSSLAVIAN